MTCASRCRPFRSRAGEKNQALVREEGGKAGQCRTAEPAWKRSPESVEHARVILQRAPRVTQPVPSSSGDKDTILERASDTLSEKLCVLDVSIDPELLVILGPIKES